MFIIMAGFIMKNVILDLCKSNMFYVHYYYYGVVHVEKGVLDLPVLQSPHANNYCRKLNY